MAITVNDKLVNDLLDGSGLADQFPAGAVLELRSGSAPGISAAGTGTLIASITLPATPWAAATSRSKGKNGTWQDASADNAGTLGHYRLRDATDDGSAQATHPRIQGSITATGGGGDMTVDNTSVTAGQQITITSFAVAVA